MNRRSVQNDAQWQRRQWAIDERERFDFVNSETCESSHARCKKWGEKKGKKIVCEMSVKFGEKSKFAVINFLFWLPFWFRSQFIVTAKQERRVKEAARENYAEFVTDLYSQRIVAFFDYVRVRDTHV